MLNNDLMSVYPAMWVGVPPDSDSDWSVARYLDGRPAGGVLVSNGMWWRYETSLNNASRQRANQVTRIFLCRDYLEIPVSFDSNVDLTNESAIDSAIKEDPGCVACHATLDPLAAFMGACLPVVNPTRPRWFIIIRKERTSRVPNWVSIRCGMGSLVRHWAI